MEKHLDLTKRKLYETGKTYIRSFSIFASWKASLVIISGTMRSAEHVKRMV
jgi:hypothetical protein